MSLFAFYCGPRSFLWFFWFGGLFIHVSVGKISSPLDATCTSDKKFVGILMKRNLTVLQVYEEFYMLIFALIMIDLCITYTGFISRGQALPPGIG